MYRQNTARNPNKNRTKSQVLRIFFYSPNIGIPSGILIRRDAEYCETAVSGFVLYVYRSFPLKWLSDFDGGLFANFRAIFLFAKRLYLPKK